MAGKEKGKGSEGEGRGRDMRFQNYADCCC